MAGLVRVLVRRERDRREQSRIIPEPACDCHGRSL
jgi:hypothetical protein